ncbi:MAG: hypothetical protein A3G32_01980 [Deltaproteobacteria bacterium RIFCSPLOWO2_12_FULL_40_28]|nr:MAG: hypothetical protein A3C45_06725 [Deltaproteobacteria bacterium RIFCSPHIGHO2_02_FULL_40_28]OGQ18898.1 MAG: hypothetical protein A3E27_09360 [Deltaproteobacteria bacterium RIFCSPHIGHO2_12_FULL_40_32]OGQ40143.1 MAG: hypothetical protein A3I69_01890 [Deltaproteobacteria bacterium RIFCSPLOWO2_02_FULL_40_36]OGQ53326.1 MAG: hypothetical protein A3G32_01980 [Deltaproteobacteria bacterium RIFCSPLOWO2_12_FULL_40_28]
MGFFHKKEEANLEHHEPVITAYGDQMNDGMVQMSFTLPTTCGLESKEAAKLFVEKMGFEKVMVTHMEAISDNFTFFVVYGKTNQHIDIREIKVVRPEHPVFSFDEINEVIEKKIGRKLVVVGACIGSDAHTVGIDAIFNMKGFRHDWGFERYPWLSAYNLRAQVAVEDLVQKVVALNADAVLISRVVTQRDEHIIELKKFLDLLKNTSGVSPHLIKICGGPRISFEDAISWGYDAGFGPGTKPSEVASFIVHEFLKRAGKN